MGVGVVVVERGVVVVEREARKYVEELLRCGVPVGRGQVCRRCVHVQLNLDGAEVHRPASGRRNLRGKVALAGLCHELGQLVLDGPETHRRTTLRAWRRVGDREWGGWRGG